MHAPAEPITNRFEHAPVDDVRESRPRLALRSWPPTAHKKTPRYQAGALLGRGGMGEVRTCEDRRVGRTVAMKVLTRGTDDVAAIERFVDEARLQGRLEHPAIVPVYDLGTTDEGTPFFTMKCVRGVTLAQVLAGRRAEPLARQDTAPSDDTCTTSSESGAHKIGAVAFSTRRLFEAFVTVCLAVEYAHRCGVVHGDLKPENVMLGRFGEVHVLDWGCATRAQVRAPRSADVVMDADGDAEDVSVLFGLLEKGGGADIVGTPGYMAPEQARGSRTDRRSDVYALGAILFELVAQERLHRGHTPLARVVATLEHPTVRPSDRAPTLAIAEALDALVIAALAEDPADRPSARQLAEGIERYLDQELATTSALRTAERHARAARDHAERALAGHEAEREAALREAGRALSLDAGNREACEVLTRLLGSAPAALPSDARLVCDAVDHGLARSAVRAMSFRAWVWSAMIVPAVAIGVRSWAGALTSIGVILACAVVFTALAARFTHDVWARRAVIVLSMAGVSSMSGIFGPLVLTPVFAVTTAVMFAVGFGKGERWLACCGAVAAVAVPLLLELAGVLPPSMALIDGTIVLLPRSMAFAPDVSLAFLAVGTLMTFPMVVMLGGKIRDAVDERVRSLAFQESQLRRALPSALADRLSVAVRRA